jgi:Holliday junction resolvase RusA-like endonuclease
MVMTVYEFNISGVNPLPKERPRFNQKTGATYTTNKTAGYENEIGIKIRSQMNEMGVDCEDFSQHLLGIIVHFRRKTRHNVDVDNLIKSLKDGLEGVLWDNDTVVKGECAYMSYDKEDYGFTLHVMTYKNWLSKLGIESYTGSVRGMDSLKRKSKSKK